MLSRASQSDGLADEGKMTLDISTGEPTHRTKSYFWKILEPNLASNDGFNDPCHDFPATKRRKLGQDQSSIPYETLISQEQLSRSQQTYSTAAIQQNPPAHNVWNEAQYHKMVKIEPGQDIQSWEPEPLGQIFDVQPAISKNAIQDPKAEESGSALASTAAEVCFGMVGP